MKKYLALLPLLASYALFSQQTVDNSGAKNVKPWPIVYSFPGVCAFGEMVTYAPTAAPNNMYECGFSNDWHLFTGSGGGATIPSTSGALKGDGSGNALAVTGTGSNCVHADGTSAVCGSGGASSASQLTDFACTNTSTVLTCTLPAGGTNVQAGSVVRHLSASPMTATLGAGSCAAGAEMYLYIDAATGNVTLSAKDANVTLANVTVSNITKGSGTAGAAPTDGSKQLWTIDCGNPTVDQFNSSAPLTDFRAYLSGQGFIAGAGITITPGAQTTIAATVTGTPSAFVDYQKVTTVLTGTGSDQTVYTTTIPSLGAGKCLHVFMGWADGGTGTETMKVSYGATSYAFRGTGVIGASLSSRFEFCNEPGVTNIQDFIMPNFNYGGTGWTTPNGGYAITGAFAVDSTTSQAFALKCNGTAGTATVTGLWWSITQDR